MLDTKQSWDDLVLRHAPDEETAYRILENRLYHNLTARFVQSHDYIAMERLFEIHASGEYDLIIIDTPPTRNAIDFLDAPARMADFFGGRLLRWLTLPYRVGGKRGTRVLNVASRPFYQMADRILGSQFLAGHRRVLPELPVDVRRVRRRGRKAVERLLHDKRTTFAVVTTLEAAPLHEAERFCADARRARLPPRRARAQQDAARLAARSRRAPRPRPRASTTPAPLADALARDGRSRARRSRRARPACCARSASRTATSRSSRCARPSCGPSSPGSPTSWRGSRPSPTTSATSRASRAIGRVPLSAGTMPA